MAEPRITILINGKTYSLCADNADALAHLPTEDRRHLITLLEAIKHQNDPTLAAARETRDKSRIPAPATLETPVSATRIASSGATRMGNGDIDALMARLAVEEKRSRKPVLTRTGIYKVTGGFLLLVFLLVVII